MDASLGLENAFFPRVVEEHGYPARKPPRPVGTVWKMPLLNVRQKAASERVLGLEQQDPTWELPWRGVVG